MRVVEKRQLLSSEEIGRTLNRLAHEIVEKSGGTKDLALIGVRRRGVPLAHRLSNIIRDSSHVEVPVGTLDITLYRDDLSTVGPQPIVQSTEIPFPRGRSGSGGGRRRAVHRPNDTRRHERPFRSGAPAAHPALRDDRSRPSRASDRGDVRRQNRRRPAIPRSWKFASRKWTRRNASCWWIGLPKPPAVCGGENVKGRQCSQRLQHLLGIEPLTREQITFILDQSKPFQEFQRHPLKKLATLRGKTVAIAFFEASTRTRISFTTAASRLGADTMSLQAESSSLKKGESLLDTVRTLEAMRPDGIVMRHSSSGAPEFVAAAPRNSRC